MPANLEVVTPGANLIGIVNHPHRKPENLALQRTQVFQPFGGGKILSGCGDRDAG